MAIKPVDVTTLSQKKFKPVDVTTAPKIEPRIEPPKVEPLISSNDLVEPKKIETPTFNREALKGNIQSSLTKFSPGAGANDPFIRGALKFAGQEETDENIANLRGKTLGNIVTELGVADQFEGFAMEGIKEEPKRFPGVQPFDKAGERAVKLEAEKTMTFDEKLNARSERLKVERETAKAEKEEEVGLGDLEEKLLQDEFLLSDAKNNLDFDAIKRIEEGNLRADELDAETALLSGRGIPMTFINREINKLNKDFNLKESQIARQETLSRATDIFNYNRLVNDVNLAQGRVDNAREEVKDSADAVLAYKKEAIEDIAREEKLKADEKQVLTDEADAQWEKEKEGYVPITKQNEEAIVKKYGEDRIFTDATGKKYLRPEFIPGTIDFIKEEQKIKNEFTNLGLEPPETKKIGEELYQWNPADQSWDKVNLSTESIQKKQDKARTLLSRIENLESMSGLSSVVGVKGPGQLFGILEEPLPGTPAADAKAEFEAIKALLTIENMGIMKGVLSDADIKILENAGTTLSTNISEASFKKELKRIKDTLKKGVSGKQLQYTSVEDYIRQNPAEKENVFQMIRENPQYSDEEIIQILDPNQSGDVATNYVQSVGQITGFGSPLWKNGLDVDLKKGDPVSSPVRGRVVAVGDNGGFGKQVQIKDTSGNTIWLSHLDEFDIDEGENVRPGDLIGRGGNTGRTIAGRGGDGSHLDITIKKSNGKFMNPYEVNNYLA